MKVVFYTDEYFNYDDVYKTDEEYLLKRLTIGKFYEVVDFSATGYRIIDDNGHLTFYNKSLFKTLEKYREDKINRLL